MCVSLDFATMVGHDVNNVCVCVCVRERGSISAKFCLLDITLVLDVNPKRMRLGVISLILQFLLTMVLPFQYLLLHFQSVTHNIMYVTDFLDTQHIAFFGFSRVEVPLVNKSSFPSPDEEVRLGTVWGGTGGGSVSRDPTSISMSSATQAERGLAAGQKTCGSPTVSPSSQLPL